ncbi:hypothetical protein [Desulfobacter postgatei]|uniref:Uncharacterized protein n=1 Tax=Desulfobacter postgatei 2ac9 TaxID=879212 RepID=I5B7A3_9BACT|nr:hypothetical protein [Desulfobacter postgatei]EIM65366.1 hypothetical protein DespoDRAFT_03615 [Desulfobacter postgatei 2ac9]
MHLSISFGHQHSETQSKPSYFRGHCWGAIGMLIGFDAYERFVMIGSIALDLLQLISLKYQNSVWREFQGFLRTKSRSLLSERTVKFVIANLLIVDLFSSAPGAIIREIQKYRFKKKMLKPGVLPEKLVPDPETALPKLE